MLLPLKHCNVDRRRRPKRYCAGGNYHGLGVVQGGGGYGQHDFTMLDFALFTIVLPNLGQAYGRPRTLVILFCVVLDVEGTMKSTASFPALQWLPRWVTVCWTVSAPTVMETKPKQSTREQSQDMTLRALPPGRTQLYLQIRLLFVYALSPVSYLVFQAAAAEFSALAGVS